MNIIDAINSGRRFRRPHMDFFYANTREKHNLTRDDILATDWEVREKKVEITEREFWSAYADALKSVTIDNRRTQYSPEVSAVVEELKKRLFER